jgi:glucan 1,3-beta-glucosidase
MTVLFADGWFDITEDWAWGGYGKDMTNVAMDTHYYTLYDEKRDFSGNERLDWFCAKDKVLSNAHLPTMVGEWSVVVPPEQSELKDMPHDSPETIAFMKKSWATQTTVYERGAGWTYWSWKTASGGAWSMKWLLEKGVVPNPITKHEVASHCF